MGANPQVSGPRVAYGSGAMSYRIESIRTGDGAQRHDLARQAFGMTDAFDPELPVPDRDRIVCAYDGDRLLGAVVTLDFATTWAETAVPCGGVSGMVMGAEARGRGIARALVRESLDRMLGRGEVLSALYPTTATLYRSLGYEIAGSYDTRRVPLRLVATGPADALDWRRLDGVDDSVIAVHDDMAGRIDGWIRPGRVWWDRMNHRFAAERSKNRYCYVGSRDGVDVAAIVYRYERSADRLYELAVELIGGLDGDAVAGALGFLARNGTTAGHFETTLPASVLALHVPNLQDTTVVNDWPWMLRLVDVAGAFAARPFPVTVSGQVELTIVDEVMVGNAGPHVLRFDAGTASLTPGGAGTVRVTVSDLAAVYAGADVRVLRHAGRLPGAAPADADLLAAACASSPTMAFFF